MANMIDIKYIELAQNNPKLFIANYLLNGLLSEHPQWHNIGDGMSERFPYLSIIYLFKNDERFNQVQFQHDYNDIITKENETLKIFIKEYSSFYNSEVRKYSSKIQDLSNTIYQQEREILALNENLNETYILLDRNTSELNGKTDLSALLTAVSKNIGIIIAHFYCVRPVYDISVLSEEKFNYSGFINLIKGMTLKNIDEAELKKQRNIKMLINYVVGEINKSNDFKSVCDKHSIPVEQIQEFDRMAIARTVRRFCGKSEVASEDTLEVADMNITGLVSYLNDNFAVTVSQEDFANLIHVSDVESVVKRLTIGSGLGSIVRSVGTLLTKFFSGISK